MTSPAVTPDRHRAPAPDRHRAPAQARPEIRAHRNGGRLGLVVLQVVTEVRSSLRTPEFAVGAVTIPVILYAMFGLTNASNELPGGTRIGCSSFSTLMAITFSTSHLSRSVISKANGRCPPSCSPTLPPLIYTVPW